MSPVALKQIVFQIPHTNNCVGSDPGIMRRIIPRATPPPHPRSLHTVHYPRGFRTAVPSTALIFYARRGRTLPRRPLHKIEKASFQLIAARQTVRKEPSIMHNLPQVDLCRLLARPHQARDLAHPRPPHGSRSPPPREGSALPREGWRCARPRRAPG